MRKGVNYIMRLLMVISISLFCVYNVNATKRAIVIGIGNYPLESGFSKINGDKDVPIVTDMLLSLGFKNNDIITLVDKDATFSNIQSAFKTLTNMSESGDVIYIHFSGHGQQITDTNGDEEDSLDEAWVPYDARVAFERGVYEGEHHIVDDLLNGWLTSIKRKIGEKGNLIVIADACHSGGSTRDCDFDDDKKDNETIRGGFQEFIISVHSKLINMTKSKYKIDWINISACEAHQVNYEYKKMNMGSLTYAIYQNKDKLLTVPANEFITLAQRIINQIITQHTQTLVLDGTENLKNNILIF